MLNKKHFVQSMLQITEHKYIYIFINIIIIIIQELKRRKTFCCRLN